MKTRKVLKVKELEGSRLHGLKPILRGWAGVHEVVQEMYDV